MAANDKSQAKAKSVAKNPQKATEKTNNQEIGNVAHTNKGFLQHVHNSITADEAARDSAIDAMEAEVAEEYMKMLQDHDVPIEKREAILKDYYARIDKKRGYEIVNKREHSKRLKWCLWMATLSVLGLAVLKNLPNIIEALRKNIRI